MKNASAALTATAMEALGRVAMLLLALASARLLEPAQLGVLGLSVIVVGIVSIVGAYTEVGAAIVEGVADDHRRAWSGTVWRVLTTAVTTSIVIIAAVPISGTLGGSPAATEELRSLLLSLLWLPWIETLSTYPRILLRRNREFSQLARVTFLGTTVFVALSVVFLLQSPNPWAVVVAQLTASTLTSGLTWWRLVRLGWKPSQERPSRPEMARVGAESFRLFLGSSGGYLSERFDNLLVAANLGAALLPFYSITWNLCRTPVALVSQALANIVTAAAIERGNQNRLYETLGNTHRFSHLLMSMSAALLAFVAPLFIEPVLGAKWAGLRPMFPVLAISLLFVPVQLSVTAYLQSQGKAHITGLTSLVHLLGQITLIPPMCGLYGVVGAGYADVANNAILTILLCVAIRYCGGDLRWIDPGSSIAVTLAAGLSAGLAALLAPVLFSNELLAAGAALVIAALAFPPLAGALGGVLVLREAARLVRAWLGPTAKASTL